MTFFEKILKKRLGDATSTKGVAPDDLWAAIEQELPPEEDKGSPLRWSGLGLALLGLFLALGLSLSLVLWEESIDASTTLATESLQENSSVVTEGITTQMEEEREATEIASASKKADTPETNKADVTNLQDEMSASELLMPTVQVSGTNPLRKYEKASARLETTDFTTKNSSARAVEEKRSIVEDAPTALGPSNQTGEGQPSAEQNDVNGVDVVSARTVGVDPAVIPTTRLPETTAVRKLDFQLPIPILVKREDALHVENFKPNAPIKQLHRPRAALGVFVGTNLLQHKYPSTATDDLADVLNGTRGEALGQSAALEFSYRLRPGLKVYTGVELLKTHTTFRYTQQWDTITMYNGQQVDAIATRRVQHNNRQTFISVPLMLEKTYAFGRWEAGLGAGISLNYLTQQSGRSLNALQQVVTYSNVNGNNLPSPNFYLSYQLRPSINYRLSNRLSIQARADLRWQRYGKSALYELSANSMLYGGSFGVVFGL